MEYGKYKIVSDGTFSMFVIRPISKGSIPKVLVGSYTTAREAMNAIDSQEAKSKKVKHAKTNSSSGV